VTGGSTRPQKPFAGRRSRVIPINLTQAPIAFDLQGVLWIWSTRLCGRDRRLKLPFLTYGTNRSVLMVFCGPHLPLASQFVCSPGVGAANKLEGTWKVSICLDAPPQAAKRESFVVIWTRRSLIFVLVAYGHKIGKKRRLTGGVIFKFVKSDFLLKTRFLAIRPNSLAFFVLPPLVPFSPKKIHINSTISYCSFWPILFGKVTISKSHFSL